MRYTFKYIEYLVKRLRFCLLTDRDYRIRRFIEDFQRPPDLLSPKTFNEKVMCRMLGDRNPLFTELADKLKMRERVKHHVGEQYLVPLLGVYKNVDEIDFNNLPDQFVLKCNHDSGSIIICQDKKAFDIRKAKKKLTFCLKRNMYYSSREWQYKDIEPRILCETCLVSQDKNAAYVASVYRTHCFNGQPAYVEVDFCDHSGGKHTGIYDTNWNLQPDSTDKFYISEPGCFREMLAVASALTMGIDYCRADFYIVDNRVYFSEFTFTPANGREKFYPEELDELLGSLWSLSSHHKECKL